MIDFQKLRNDPAHHLGLGDIRLTIAQQEEIEARVAELERLLLRAQPHVARVPGVYDAIDKALKP